MTDKFKKYLLYLPILIFILMPHNAYASKKCFGAEKQEGNRFEHCKKGDIIQVYTNSLKNVDRWSLGKTSNFALRWDEVSDYCSYGDKIAFVGETEIVDSSPAPFPMTLRWFTCVYIGHKRDAVLSPDYTP